MYCYFSRPCLSTFFIKTKRSLLHRPKRPQRGETRPKTGKAKKKDYTTIETWPKATTYPSNCLYPACSHETISSSTKVSSTSWLLAWWSKVRLLRSFHINQETRITNVSKHLLSPRARSFLAWLHQSTKKNHPVNWRRRSVRLWDWQLVALSTAMVRQWDLAGCGWPSGLAAGSALLQFSFLWKGRN